MTLAELYRELEAHDWYYEQSEDARVYRAGRENALRLELTAKTINGGLNLCKAFAKHVFSGPPYGTVKAPKPACPACGQSGPSPVVGFIVETADVPKMVCDICRREVAS